MYVVSSSCVALRSLELHGHGSNGMWWWCLTADGSPLLTSNRLDGQINNSYVRPPFLASITRVPSKDSRALGGVGGGRKACNYETRSLQNVKVLRRAYQSQRVGK